VGATGDPVPSPVPANLEVPAGNEAFLKGHAAGTHNYLCLPSDSSFAWTFFGPQATLFNDDDQQIITHFLRLTRTTFIQRLNTSGGIAPSTGCTQPIDLGTKALVPYTADYFFYKAAESQ
jgi:uncharacterized protein DUF3455